MRRSIRTALAAGLALAGTLTLLTACETTEEAETQPAEATSMGAINDTCPMSGMPINDSTTVTYHGATVGFCGEGCKTTWMNKSAAEKNAFLAKFPDR
jgi:hypothetical protein